MLRFLTITEDKENSSTQPRKTPITVQSFTFSSTKKMFDNICSLPFQTDIFSQAAHPSQPIFTIGLASGHVYSHRLPDVGHVADHDNDDDTSISSDKSTRSKRNGFDKVERVWETRRHKGSCRSLCYSADGRSLFSAGSDGLVKAADFGTGQVSSKIAVPVESYVCLSYTIEIQAKAH